MPSSVVRLTTQDHERMARLLRRTCGTGPNRGRWRAEFVALLRAHRFAERDCVVPAVSTAEPPLDTRARQQDDADTALDRLAEEVESADLEALETGGFYERLQPTLDAHAAAMSALLHAFDDVTPRKEMRRLGGEYEARRDAAMQGRTGGTRPPRRLDLSRAELYELARRAGVQGRSAMSRAQLIEELQRRQAP